MKKEWSLVISTGFALFAMFFGSGNLVFPLVVGLESEGHFFSASLGVLVTCVIFPLLGMLGMTLHQGSLESFFAFFGKKGIFIFSLLCLSLMGPFGVLARCLTVIHGAMVLLIPDVTLFYTSLTMCILIFLLAANKTKMVTIVGTVLTPFLLASLAAIVVFALPQENIAEASSGGMKAFQLGFFKGYQTMDLVASFFFSGFLIQHLYAVNGNNQESKATLKLFLKSSVIGGALLYIVYLGLVYLGSLFAPLLVHTEPQNMFGIVAQASLGVYAAPIVALAVVLACLTTAIALTTLFADFLEKDVCKNNISRNASLLTTLLIAFGVSNLAFSGIAAFLAPILETIYPALISLTIINIGLKLYRAKSSRSPFSS